MLCNLQILSGCVCHLEQLHAQSPFLFPIVFGINLIPFFDICSADLCILAAFQPGCSGLCYLLYLGGCAVATVAVCGLAAGLWCLTAGCHVKSPLFPQPPLKQKCAPRSRWEKAYMRRHTYKLDRRLFHNPTLSANKQVVQICRSALSAAVQMDR